MNSRFYAMLGVSLLIMAGRGSSAAELKVAAAANLQKVMTGALIPAFQKKTGATVLPTFGSTKQLAVQLQNGAPEDVFVSADTQTVTKLASSGTLDGSTEKVYAIGKLVMWTRADAKRHPRRVEDLRDPAYATIAIANPKLAPYGLAAQQSLEKTGIAQGVARRVVQAENIAEALQYAKSGNADVSFTALSLVIDDRTDPYVVVPGKLYEPIAQSAAVVKGTSQPGLAASFVAFLTGKDAAPIWKRYGYGLPKKQP